MFVTCYNEKVTYLISKSRTFLDEKVTYLISKSRTFLDNPSVIPFTQRKNLKIYMN